MNEKKGRESKGGKKGGEKMIERERKITQKEKASEARESKGRLRKE